MIKILIPFAVALSLTACLHDEDEASEQLSISSLEDKISALNISSDNLQGSWMAIQKNANGYKIQYFTITQNEDKLNISDCFLDENSNHLTISCSDHSTEVIDTTYFLLSENNFERFDKTDKNVNVSIVSNTELNYGTLTQQGESFDTSAFKISNALRPNSALLIHENISYQIGAFSYGEAQPDSSHITQDFQVSTQNISITGILSHETSHSKPDRFAYVNNNGNIIAGLNSQQELSNDFYENYTSWSFSNTEPTNFSAAFNIPLSDQSGFYSGTFHIRF